MQGRVNEDTGRLGERREGELCFPDFNVGKVEMTLGGWRLWRRTRGGEVGVGESGC